MLLVVSLILASQMFAPVSSWSALASTAIEHPADQMSSSTERDLARPSGQWSMFMNGPLRRGRTPIVGAQTSHLAWRISTETNYGGPVVGRDGTIYQGTFAGQLLALNPDGTT